MSLRQARRFIVGLAFGIPLLPLAALGQSDADVPESLLGTYSLTYNMINEGGLFVDGQEVTMVLRDDDTVCLGDVSLSDPVHREGDQVQGIWVSQALGVEVYILNFIGSFQAVNITALNGQPTYGQLTGEKISDSQNCDNAPQVSDTMNTIFDLAESKAPEYFPPGAVTLYYNDFIYRYYQSTGIYLAFDSGRVYVLGGPFGDAIVDVGTLNSIEGYLHDFGGLWDLTITGQITVNGTSQNFPVLTYTGLQVPGVNDAQALNDLVFETVEEINTGVSEFSFEVLTNTSSRRVFEISLNVTQGGQSLSYTLNYEFTR